jgi:hypothetical protein
MSVREILKRQEGRKNKGCSAEGQIFEEKKNDDK